MRRLAALPVAVLATGCAMRPWTPSVSVAYESEDTPAQVVTAVPAPIEGISRWQLPPESPWSHYVKLTLLTSLDGSRPVLDLPAVRQLDVVQKAELAAGSLAVSGLPEDTMWMIDLRGAASVAFGAKLSHLSRDPVASIPTFNNWPAEEELVPAEETLAAMVTMWPKQPASGVGNARPVFLLDAWRLAYRFDDPGDDVIDNRYMLTSADLPDADVLRARSIRRVVYVVENLDDTSVEEDDVNEAALAWQAAGIEMFLVDLDWLIEQASAPRWTERLVPTRLVVSERATVVSDPAFYARARGGFGGVHSGPSPFHGGGSAFVTGAHGGG